MEQLRRFTSSSLEPHARGVEFGRTHRAEVARSVASYRRLFAATAVEPFDVDLWGERAAERIAELAPAHHDEIRGIAEGAGLPVGEVAALNARTELLAVANPTGVPECSTVVATRPGRAPLAVQTWDWYDAMADNWLLWTIPHPDGRVVQTVTEYGVLGKIGVSDAGVGVLFNMLHHDHDHDRLAGQRGLLGFPLHLLSRRILDTARSVDDALALARSVTPSASSSLTVVDESRAAASIEMFPGGPGVVEPEDGLLVRTNHFVSAAGETGCLADAIGPGSRVRRTTLLEALTDEPPATADDVVSAMADHREVGGVCAHPDESTDPALWHATLATVRLDVAGRGLDVTPGGPCRARSGSAEGEPGALRATG